MQSGRLFRHPLGRGTLASKPLEVSPIGENDLQPKSRPIFQVFEGGEANLGLAFIYNGLSPIFGAVAKTFKVGLPQPRFVIMPGPAPLSPPCSSRLKPA
jgi:hypothetical protein